MSSPLERPTEMWEPTPEGLERARRHLGYELRARRKKADLSQAQVAKIAGVSQQMYSRFEQGTAIISYQPLLRLAQHYGCKMKELIEGQQSYPSAPLDPVDRLEHVRARNRRLQEGSFEAGEIPGTFRRKEVS